MTTDTLTAAVAQAEQTSGKAADVPRTQPDDAGTPGPLDHQNGVQRHEASAGCALSASSLESGNAREATCLSGDHDARQPVAYTAWTVRDHAGSTPAAPTDPIADLMAALRVNEHAADEYWGDLCGKAADALERLAREWEQKQTVLLKAHAYCSIRAERAEAERDALRECVRAADGLRAECDQVPPMVQQRNVLHAYDAARAKVKP